MHAAHPVHSFDFTLTALSVLLAGSGSYVTLTLFSQLGSVAPGLRKVWSALVAAALGLTIWAMHFVGLLASHLPAHRGHDPALTALSLGVAMAAAWLGFRVVERREFRGSGIVLGGLLLGLGITAMHLVGMAALPGDLGLGYALNELLGAVGISLGASVASLYVYRYDRPPHLRRGARVWAAALLGGATSATHYAAMRATSFSHAPAEPSSGGDRLGLALALTLVLGLLLVLLGVAMRVGRSLARRSEHAAQLQRALHLGEERSWTVVNALTEGVLLLDPQGRVERFNRSAGQIFGVEPGQTAALQRLIEERTHDAEGRPLPHACLPGQEAIATGSAVQGRELALRLPGPPGPDGAPTERVTWISVAAQPLPAAPGEARGAVVSFTDVTEARRSKRQLWWQATRDDLTGLLNRQAFHAELDRALEGARAAGRRLAVLYLDLDHFKDVNDTLGHAAGDEYLCAVAHRLEAVTPPRTVLARFGGDEFALLVPDLTADGGLDAVLNRLQTVLVSPVELQGRRLHLSLSTGLSLFPEDGTDRVSLLQHADLALNQVKASERGGVLRYSPEHAERRAREVTLADALRQAVKQEGGQFFLVYQPIFNLADRELHSCEALLRWTHPDLGAVSPAEFIPLAEQHGLIDQLGEWVLREACSQGQAWRRAGWDVPVAVNVSMRQFQGGRLPALVRAVLAAHDLPPHLLTVEVTESTLMDEQHGVVEQLDELRANGVQVALDDFGTGFSGLQLLHRLPIDKLKLDRSFVQGMAVDARQGLVVRAIASLAEGLHLTTIAEGIETETQLGNLRSLHCTLGQGYLLARPQSAAQITELLQARGSPLAQTGD